MKAQHTHIAISLIIAAFAVIGCSGSSNNDGNSRNRLVPAVEAVEARFGSLPLVERLSGVVKAKNQVEIYSEISAVVESVHVENGDEVTKGQPLVSLRDREFQERLKQAIAAQQIAAAQAKQAEARLNEINSELRRTKALAEKNLTSDADLETIESQAISAEADVQLAHARVEQARANAAEQEEVLTQTVIRAPVSGTVGNRNAEVGMMVGNGTRLFTLGQLDTVRVEVVLTDRMLDYIKSGQRADIQATNIPSGSLTASLSRISPFLHPVTHSTDAEIDMANPDHNLKSGMFVTVDIYYGESEKATLVPLSALYENPLTGATGVYVSRDTSNTIEGEGIQPRAQASLTEPVPFEFVPVDVIAKGRMNAGISGLDPGNWVVTIGQDLFGGQSGDARVRPVNWEWVEELQNLQREDLLDELVKKQQEAARDSTAL